MYCFVVGVDNVVIELVIFIKFVLLFIVFDSFNILMFFGVGDLLLNYRL